MRVPNDILMEMLSFVPRSCAHCVVSEQWAQCSHLMKISLTGAESFSELDHIFENEPTMVSYHRLSMMTLPQLWRNSSRFMVDLAQTKRQPTMSLALLYMDVNSCVIAHECAVLQFFPRLVDLTLVFFQRVVTMEMFQGVIQISACTQLSSLHLDFLLPVASSWDDLGGRELDRISCLVHLSSLYMALHGRHMGEETVLAISHLSSIRSLKCVCLDFSDNDLSNASLSYLAAFSKVAGLENAQFNFKCNDQVTDDGALQFAQFHLNPSLEKLTVDFPDSVSDVAFSILRTPPRHSLRCCINGYTCE
jgi:hypothetical protein